MTARNGPVDADRRLPEGERRIGERLGGQLESTDRTDNPPPCRAEVRNVYADGVQVRGTRGRDRLLLFVRCWLCGRTHQHGAKTDFVCGRRTAACGLGSYLVHIGSIEGQAAA